jgi:hypothetical protein
MMSHVARSRFLSGLKNSTSQIKSIRFESTQSASTKESVPVVASLLAAFAGVSGVSVAAAAVESATSESCPPFSVKGQRYDQDAFVGRFSRMIQACDPRLLFYTIEQVNEAQALIEKAEEYKDDRSMDRTLWEAKRIADAALHPDTKEVIPRPFRMSGFAPFNGPICVSMIASTSTVPLLFWSWANQSQNALVNYYVSLTSMSITCHFISWESQNLFSFVISRIETLAAR